MVELLVSSDVKKTEKLFLENNISFNENSKCLEAICGEEILGYSLFDMDKEKIIIKLLKPENDLPLIDGILRSTLHVATERSIMNAFYEDTVSETMLSKIQFIKDKTKKSLDIDKLFGGCNCKK